MHQFWKKGISPREFKKNYIKDIKVIMDIENACVSKEIHENKVRTAIEKMRHG